VRVSCPSAKACMAVGSTLNNAGDMGQAAAITWNGRAWKVHDAPSPGFDPGLSSVSCLGGLQCNAVGSYTTDQPPCQCALIAAWNGSAWHQVTNPTFTGSPSAVSCWQLTGCVAVDGSLALIEQAGTWKQETVAAPGGAAASLSDISCWHASACIAVGHYVTSAGAQLTLAERWNGHTWTVTRTWTPAPSARRTPAVRSRV
jgi:hypothetical protein